MSSNICPNCGLGYDSLEEMKKHQQKFCVGSNYEDPTKIEQRFNQLNNEKPGLVAQGDVKAYVGGHSDQLKPVDGYNEVLGFDRFNNQTKEAQVHRAQLQDP